MPSIPILKNTNIYSLWESSKDLTSIDDFSSLNAAQLYAIS